MAVKGYSTKDSLYENKTCAHSSHARLVKAARMKGAKLRKFSSFFVCKNKRRKSGNVPPSGLGISMTFASL